MSGSATLACPAKLNLALAVAPPDPRDAAGLHPIASWMVAVDFYDTLVVERLGESCELSRTEQSSAFKLAYAEDAPSPRVIDWGIEQDLVFRAHARVEAHVRQALPIAVSLQKRIPTGAGLGGGSSDAAGMLLALNQLFDLHLDDASLQQLAASLGSDVHFALAALSSTTSAIVSGSGDRVEPLAQPNAWPLHLVLVLPAFGCPTGPVYAAFDRLVTTQPGPLPIDRLHKLAAGFDPITSELFNDLTNAAIHVEPRLGVLIDNLKRLSPRPVHVTGSGAACFIVAASADEADDLRQTIVDQLDVPTIATRTL